MSWRRDQIPPEDPNVASVEEILEPAASRSEGEVPRRDGRLVVTHAAWLCAATHEMTPPRTPPRTRAPRPVVTQPEVSTRAAARVAEGSISQSANGTDNADLGDVGCAVVRLMLLPVRIHGQPCSGDVKTLGLPWRSSNQVEDEQDDVLGTRRLRTTCGGLTPPRRPGLSSRRPRRRLPAQRRPAQGSSGRARP